MSEAKEITRRVSQIWLLPSFLCPKKSGKILSRSTRSAGQVDDAADDPNVPMADRKNWLQGWRRWLRQAEPGEPGFARELRTLNRKISNRSTSSSKRFCLAWKWTWSPFDSRTSRPCTSIVTASPARLVWSASKYLDIEILNAKSIARRLGVALQLTNIIRDVDKDLQNGGRVYLPLNELAMFGYPEEALRNRTYNASFFRLMQFQAERAHSFFREARRLLPAEDRRSMVAAEGMRAIYFALLRRIEKDRFRLFERTYRLNRAEKAMLLLGPIAANSWR